MTAMAVILGGILLPAGAASEADHQIRKVWPAHQRSGAGAERESSIVSPNGDFSINFSVKDTNRVKGGMFWKVDYKGKTVMEDSQLGFTLQDAPSLEAGFEIIWIEQTEHDSTWEPVCGEQAEIRDHYNQLQVTVEDHQSPPRRMILTFRAYDEGAAVQVTFPKQEAFTELTIQSEQTQFRFAGDHLAWTTRHAQGKYEKRPLSSLNPKHEYERPFVMKTEDGGYLAILEAGLLDYARMRIGLDKRVPHAVVSRLSGSATITTPYSTPWRVVMAASSPGKLLQRNYLLLNLSPPCKLADASWIKPGKQMRDVTISTAGSKAIVDFADKLGLDYLEIDAGWYGVDFFLDPGDLEWLVRYANYISFASARSAQDWARMKPWERYCAARNEMCKTWPLSAVSVTESDIDEREGRAALQVQTTDGVRTVEFVKIDGMWKIKGFFGSRQMYESEVLIAAIEKQLPQEYHVRNVSGDDEFYDDEEEY